LTGIVPDAGLFDWTYVATVQPDQKVVPGDFFTIYDFRDAVSSGFGGSLEAGSSTFEQSESLVGPPVPNLAPPDDPTLKNITVTVKTGGLDPNPNFGSVVLGTLIVKSHFNLPVDSFYAAASHTKLDLSVSNGGSVAVASDTKPLRLVERVIRTEPAALESPW
jgi:hypothetical protein